MLFDWRQNHRPPDSVVSFAKGIIAGMQKVRYPQPITALLSLLAFSSILNAEKVLFSERGWVVVGPEVTDCSTMPSLTLKGPENLLDQPQREYLQTVSIEIFRQLHQRCPSMREAVLVSGRRRRLISAPVQSIVASSSTVSLDTKANLSPSPRRQVSDGAPSLDSTSSYRPSPTNGPPNYEDVTSGKWSARTKEAAATTRVASGQQTRVSQIAAEQQQPKPCPRLRPNVPPYAQWLLPDSGVRVSTDTCRYVVRYSNASRNAQPDIWLLTLLENGRDLNEYRNVRPLGDCAPLGNQDDQNDFADMCGLRSEVGVLTVFRSNKEALRLSTNVHPDSDRALAMLAVAREILPVPVQISSRRPETPRLDGDHDESGAVLLLGAVAAYFYITKDLPISPTGSKQSDLDALCRAYGATKAGLTGCVN
jgi:hypothetical protein